jgi:hypothetical protein
VGEIGFGLFVRRDSAESIFVSLRDDDTAAYSSQIVHQRPCTVAANDALLAHHQHQLSSELLLQLVNNIK